MATTVRSAPAVSRKARRKADRTLRLLACLDNGSGILQITEGKKIDRYFFAPLPSDFGTAYTVEKWQDATDNTPAGIVQRYEVCLDGDESTCECRGFNRWSHCRHIESLTALRDAGRLTAKPAHCDHENVAQHEDGFIVCHDCGAEW